MAKNIVVGALRFLGFHLCNSFLHKGQEVIGIEWDEESIQDRDEKELLLGRNSNFTLLSDSKVLFLDGDNSIYISGYDYLSDGKRRCSHLFLEKLDRIFSSSDLSQCKIYMFFPQTLPIEWNDEVGKWIERVQKNTSIQQIYLSDLYGPWLPNTSDLQKNMSGEKIFIDMSRSMYIEDFLVHLNDITNQNKTNITVKAQCIENWREQITKFFDLELTEEIPKSSDKNAYILPSKTSLIEGLQLLKEHNKKLRFIQRWNEK